jgi:hypothetical protein
MSLLNKIDKAFTSVFDIFFALLILAAAAGSAFLAWNILGMTEQTLLIQIGGTILAAIIGAAIGWLALQVMKIFA